MNMQSLEVASSNGLGGDAFTRKYSNCHLTLVNVTQDVDQYPLHHLTYAPTKVEVATSKGGGVYAFTRKYRFCPVTLTLCSRSHAMLASTVYIM